MLTSTQLQAVATLAARRAGEHVLANLNRRADANSVQRSDIKHKLDVEAQEVATAVIHAAFPDHVIFGEESETPCPPETGYVWIIDPIDGTVNFFHGSHWWCCSVAVRYNGKSLAAAVFIPQLNQMFEATHDGQATCNGTPIHVSDQERPELALMATGMGKWQNKETPLKIFQAITELVQRPRMMGAAAADICMVAAGRVDAFFESGIYLWDIAAAGLIVERAGGTCEILAQYPNGRLAFLATNSRLHTPCKAVIAPLVLEHCQTKNEIS
jgi:myo-inositol-1(or 4)-monophosphatase